MKKATCCRHLKFMPHTLWQVAAWLSGSAVDLDQRSYSMPGPVSTGMDDRLRTGKPPRFVTSHSGHLSLLLSVGQCGDGLR